MKLSELLQRGQDTLRRRLNTEKQSWDASAVWWRGDDKVSEAAMEMKAWFAAFNKFAAAVLSDEDIDAAFKEWSGQDAREHDVDKLNSPQYGFSADYKHALHQLEQSLQ